jgi:Bacterial cell division membrane protein
MLFVAGTPWRHLAVLGGAVVIVAVGVLWAAPAAGVDVLKSYQQQRLTCFHASLDLPRRGPVQRRELDHGGRLGQIRGRGPEGATQVSLGFLPESQTDFVFAGFAEQRGFVGAALLLGLYLLVLWRGCA